MAPRAMTGQPLLWSTSRDLRSSQESCQLQCIAETVTLKMGNTWVWICLRSPCTNCSLHFQSTHATIWKYSFHFVGRTPSDLQHLKLFWPPVFSYDQKVCSSPFARPKFQIWVRETPWEFWVRGISWQLCIWSWSSKARLQILSLEITHTTI